MPPCSPWDSTRPERPAVDEEEPPVVELMAAAPATPSCTRRARYSLAQAPAHAMLASLEALRIASKRALRSS
eukprot:4019566-Alexandrium_andersonii.AAC.1